MTEMRTVLTSLALFLATGTAHAADIYPVFTEKKDLAVTVIGEINIGDEVKFKSVVKDLPAHTLIYLRSPGGDLDIGLNIAYRIRAQQFDTIIPNDATCSSACALIWLAGGTRWVFTQARIGFHSAAYHGSEVVAAEGNALVGTYLAHLGLTDRAIAFITKAPPQSYEWLTAKKAEELGIQAKTIQSKRPVADWKPQPYPVN